MNVRKTHIALVAGSLVAGGFAIDQANKPDTLTRVIDGDTIVINGSTKVRLWGIDAPELDQQCVRPGALNVQWACGKVSKGYLESFFKPNVKLSCTTKNKDRYGRSVAICYTINLKGDKHDIGKSLVSAGMALDYPEYSNGAYENDQEYARQQHLGVWSGSFQNPADYRARVKSGK